MSNNEERLTELRAHLAEAEAALVRAEEEGKEAAVKAAKALKARAEKALRQLHLELERAEGKDAGVETRPAEVATETRPKAADAPAAPAAEPEASPETLMASNQSASTQNVRGTHLLTPEQHAARRNPKHT